MNERKPGGSARWLAHPVPSLLVAATWLLLQQSLAPVQLILAAALAVVIPRLVADFLGPPVPLRSMGRVSRFSLRVLLDIVTSNVTVARIVLNPLREPQPCWVRVPLRLDHPNAVAAMASIITMTPGTVSCVIDEERGEILVHALDCDDPQALAREIVQRYEQPLLEIVG
jgi:multicomponent K+:H+ antiporter subunit E